MKNQQPTTPTRLYSPRATLCAIGIKLRSLQFFDTIAAHVHIRQKTIKHTPVEKLTDAFIAILSGAHGLSEINTRVRSDAALERAFGRNSCAEQSVVQETLDACTVENVRRMKYAFKALMQAHSLSYRHPYQARLQLLDVDMTGLPCGRRAEKASKGYFANQPGRHGRQMARVVATHYRVVATHYEEVVLDWVGPGNVQLDKVLRPLIEETVVSQNLCWTEIKDSDKLFFEVCALKKSPVRAVPRGTSRRMAQPPIENKSIGAGVAAASSLRSTRIAAASPSCAP
jgi:hypothetical protein